MDGTGERRGLPRPTSALVFISGYYFMMEAVTDVFVSVAPRAGLIPKLIPERVNFYVNSEYRKTLINVFL